jgi:hypothetical protein
MLETCINSIAIEPYLRYDFIFKSILNIDVREQKYES